ncbi:tyrosinase family oxidase copper chaperone [Streptomyces sp. NPDC052610]|uniref:tyrosinase family oxidase copper chaperone n=1 Tax=Streptomyces sp. NPDC052610 TaxID=3154952 RepID=UPI003414E835
MAVSVGAAAVNMENEPGRAAGTPDPPAGTPDPPAGRGTRRDLARGMFAAAVALTIAPLVVASRPARREDPQNPQDPQDPPADVAFDEIYRGRRIRGLRAPGAVPASAAGRVFGTDGWHVTVDGHPLHLMRRADGGWLTMVDHYRSYPTPLEAARAAVDELGPGQSLGTPDADTASGEGTHEGTHEGTRGQGGHHGVHP